MAFTFKQRLLAAITAAAVLPMLLVGAASTYLDYQQSRRMAVEAIGSVESGAVQALQRYLDTVQNQVEVQARSAPAHAALKDFTAAEAAFDAGQVPVDMSRLRTVYEAHQKQTDGTEAKDVNGWLPGNPTALALQYLYIAENPNTPDARGKMAAARDGSQYSKAHGQYHGDFYDFQTRFGYGDYYLIDATGRIVYSNAKRIDFQSSMKDGPFAGSGLGEVVRKALASHKPGEVFFSDVGRYVPAGNAPVLFAAAPVIENGAAIGAVALEVKADSLDEAFMPVKGLGKAADGFVVGGDLTLRTDRISKGGQAGEKADAALAGAVRHAIDGRTSGVVDYRGADGGLRHAAVTYLGKNGPAWAVVVEMADSGIVASVCHGLSLMAALVLAVIALSVLGGLVLGKRLVTPLEDLARSFRSGAGNVARSTGEVGEAVALMVAANEEASAQSSAVRESSREAAGHVASVSRAVEEVHGSIQDISQSINGTNALVEDAAGKAQRTDEVVRKLGEARRRITEVVGLINSLAEQTNLLALNAAIEAARAGEAGRGFAVVADEVKKLANHTSQATVDISEQVRDVQDVSDQSVAALRAVVEAIHRIRGNAVAVSAAVEEQTDAVKQITAGVQEAAQRVADVDGSMTGIEQAANDTSIAASQVSGAAGEMQQAFDKMKKDMETALRQMGVEA